MRTGVGLSSAAEIVSDAAGFVLAGGASSRMGTDKALVSLSGRPLIEHSLAILHEAGLNASIAGARSSLTDIAPVVTDPTPDLGPLAGVCAALASTCAQWAVLLSVDLPLIPASLISYLLRHARITGAAVTLAAANGFPQTFPAVIDRAMLPGLSAELEAGRSGCFSAFRSAAASLAQNMAVLPVELLAQAGHAVHPAGLPAALWFVNVNTPADLERAERLAGAQIA
ncbi:MAG: molybdenum cofactor guanylyltransferase [Terracidiphilus sp.]